MQRKVFRIAVPKPKACFVEVGEFYGQGVVIMEIRRVVRAFACSFVSFDICSNAFDISEESSTMTVKLLNVESAHALTLLIESMH